MQLDLARTFDLKAFIKMQSRPSVVLTSIDTNLIKSRNKVEFENVTGYFRGTNVDTILVFKNTSLKQVVKWLRYFTEDKYPFYDQADFHGNVDVQIRVKSISPLSVVMLAEDLIKSGLILTMTDREIPILHLSE